MCVPSLVSIVVERAAATGVRVERIRALLAAYERSSDWSHSSTVAKASCRLVPKTLGKRVGRLIAEGVMDATVKLCCTHGRLASLADARLVRFVLLRIQSAD